MKVIIGVPVTERGVRRLSRRLAVYARRYSSIALPLPQSLCARIAAEGGDALNHALKLLNPSGFRVWGSLLTALRDLVLDYPDAEVGCYASEESYATSKERGYTIAALTVKARAYNIVNPEEWLKVFESPPPRTIAGSIAGYNAIVADGYSWMVKLRREIRPSKLLILDITAPTPLDILDLMASGYLDTSSVREVIDYAVKYIGEYVVTSRTLTQAYDKLLTDKGYLELLKRLRLKVYEPGRRGESSL